MTPVLPGRRAGRARAAGPGSVDDRTEDATTGRTRRSRFRLGVTPRLLLVHAAILVAIIGVVGIQLEQLATASLVRTLDRDLAEEVTEYADAANLRPPQEPLATFSAAYLQTHQLPSGHRLLVALTRPAAGGQQILESPHTNGFLHLPIVRGWLNTPPNQPQLATVSLGDQHYRVLASPIIVGGQHRGLLISAGDLSAVEHSRERELLLLGTEAGIAVLAALIGAYLLLRRVLGTVARLTETADRISREGLETRLGYRGPDDEVGQLARTFDQMLDRVSDAFESQRQLLANVSHQLRTPLTVIRGHLEVLARTGAPDPSEVSETVALVLDELDQTGLLVERMLLLGQALEPDFLTIEPVDLPMLLADVFDAAQILADRRWRLRPVPPLVVQIDRAKVRAALFNLVDNAVKATGPGDRIELAAYQRGGFVLEVSDSGIGIPTEQQSAVFERFHRASSDRRGAGLGLAIVRAVAEAHGGEVELLSTSGQGCTVRMVLPADRVVVPRARVEST